MIYFKPTEFYLKSNKLDFILIISISLCVVISNTVGNFVIGGDDWGLNYLFTNNPYEKNSAWDENNFGRGTTTNAISLGWNFALHYIAFLLKSPSLHSVIFGIVLVVTNLTMYGFLWSINKGDISDSQRRTASFIGSVFYTYSPFVMTIFFQGFYSYHLFIWSAPAFLLALNLLFQEESFYWFYIFIVVIFLVGINENISHTLGIIIFSVFYVIFTKKNLKVISDNKNKLILLFITMCLISSYIWMPIIANALDIDGSATVYGVIDKSSTLLSVSVNSSKHGVLHSLIGTNFPFSNSINYFENYKKSITSTIALIYLAGISIFSLVNAGNEREKRFWLISIIIFIFLAKGIGSPFGNLNSYFFKLSSYLGMFRAVYYKFYIFTLLAFSVLLSFGVVALTKSPKNNLKKILMALVIGCLFIRGYPFLSGDIIQSDYKLRVPVEYVELIRFLDESPKFQNVLALPATPNGAGNISEWGPGNVYIGQHLLSHSNKPYIDSFWFLDRQYFGMDITDSWYGQSIEENLFDILNIAINKGIGWIWVQKDGVDFYQFRPDKNIREINTKLKSDAIIKSLESYDKINKIIENKYFNLYEVDQQYLHSIVD